MPTSSPRTVYRKAFIARFTTRPGIARMLRTMASIAVMTTTLSLGRIAILSRKRQPYYMPFMVFGSYVSLALYLFPLGFFTYD